MPSLLLMSQRTYQSLTDSGVDLASLIDLRVLVEQCSVVELADMQKTLRQFPYRVDTNLNLNIVPSPASRLSLYSGDDEAFRQKAERMAMRLQQRLSDEELIENTRLSAEKHPNGVYYTLYPVDECLWVVVAQSAYENGDPITSPSRDRDFFTRLLSLLNTSHSFETLSRSNIFTYYLNTLPRAS